MQWSWHSAKLGNFAECQDIALRIDFLFIFTECQAREALSKELFKKIKKWFCRVLVGVALGKEFLKKNKKCLCRVP